MRDSDDELAELLGPPAEHVSPALHHALLRQTERVVQQRLWVRRIIQAIAVASVFMLGSGFGWWARSGNRPELATVDQQPMLIPIVVLVPVPGEPAISAPLPKPPPISATQIELRAELADDPAEVARLYRTAGDAFLRDQDYRNATRCYQLFLTQAGDSALLLTPTDSWLLTSLKNAAYKEKFHALAPIDG